MVAKKKKSQRLVVYEDLREAWWSIYDGYDWCIDNQIREYMTRMSFETLLVQCNWSAREWNEEIDRDKK